MRQLFMVAFILATITAFSQGQTLHMVYVVKPKVGQTGIWETSWKAHVAKFHNSNDKVQIYEVLTGPDAGSFHEVHGPMSYADMDKERSDRTAHNLDYEKTVAHHLASETGPMIMGLRDSLSFNSNIQANKMMLTFFHVKPDKMSDFLAESRRSAKVNTNRKAPYGVATFVQNFSGTSPLVVSVRTLKDGFKELEQGYFQRPPNEFRDAYLKEYGQEMWDKRSNSFLTMVNSTEVMLVKHRKDLSSK